jgi:hypothetical protein
MPACWHQEGSGHACRLGESAGMPAVFSKIFFFVSFALDIHYLFTYRLEWDASLKLFPLRPGQRHKGLTSTGGATSQELGTYRIVLDSIFIFKVDIF